MKTLSPRLMVAGLAGLLAACISFGAATAQPAGPASVVIPNLWDPVARAPAAEDQIDGIRFVTTDDFPPFSFTDGEGRLIGFNVDLARAICDQLSVPCTIQVRPFEDLVAALLDDRADAAIAGIAISLEMRRVVTFSDVYLRLPARFVVRRGFRLEISAQALAGQRIAVVLGTAHEAYLRAFFAGAVVMAYSTSQAAQSALRSGQADLLFGDGMRLAFWLQGTAAAGCCSFAGGPYLESAFFGPGMAIAIVPEAAEILAAINGALRSVYARGAFSSLYLRYFPISFF